MLQSLKIAFTKPSSFTAINRPMSKERFTIQPSKEMQDGWVATDTENDIVLRFENHKFNTTLRCTVLNLKEPEPTANELAVAVRDLLDWLRAEHHDKVF